METPFKKSLLYSTLTHALLLLFFFGIYKNFLIVRTPLLMELTLIGQMSQGNGMGSPASHPGEVPSQMPVANTDTGQFSNPQKQTANPPIVPAEKPEVAVRKPLNEEQNPGTAKAESYLEHVRKQAPIGLTLKNDIPTNIKTTAGLGHVGVAGTPGGSSNIEGELSSRKKKREVDPIYPEWAKKQGIEATIRFRLTALPNGLLREDDLQLEQTCGYRELDRLVYEALIQWEFEPLPPEVPQQDQSGIITFSFNLK
jgi:protein TonB